MLATPTPPACIGFANSETSSVHSEVSTTSAESASPTSVDFSDVHEQIPRRRSSAFFESGLLGDDSLVDARLRRNSRPRVVRFRSKVEVVEPEPVPIPESDIVDEMPPYFPTLGRLLFFALVIAIVLPSLGNSPLLQAGIGPIGAKAGPVAVKSETYKSLPQKRQDSSTDICKRWSGQSAVVNGTIYYYGGRATSSSEQTSDTWSMSFISCLTLPFTDFVKTMILLP